MFVDQYYCASVDVGTPLRAKQEPVEYMVRAYTPTGAKMRYVGDIDTYTTTWRSRTTAHLDLSQHVGEGAYIVGKIELFKVSKESEAEVEVVNQPKRRLQYWSF